MKTDSPENPFLEHPIRPVPRAWRDEILARARQARGTASSASSAPEVVTSQGQPWIKLLWREWLWPHPAAWGALAALWLVTLSLNALTSDPNRSLLLAQTAIDPPLPARMAASQHYQLRRELLHEPVLSAQTETPPRAEPSPADRPRSDRRRSLAMA